MKTVELASDRVAGLRGRPLQDAEAMSEPVGERTAAFRKEWETLTAEEKENALGCSRAQLNALLTIIHMENERSDLTAQGNGCKEKNCPRKFHWHCFERSLQVAIQAITENQTEDAL